MNHVLEHLKEQIYASSMTEPEKEACLQKLLQGQQEPIGILLLGSTGSGKSSTINALFGETVAEVGNDFEPQTQEIQEYRLENLTIWDCPGPGDNPERDAENARLIRDKLTETDENDNYLVDLVMVVLDAAQRDMAVAYQLINELALPVLGDEAEQRLLIGINKIDLLRSGWGWNHEAHCPGPELQASIEAKENSVRSRIAQATELQVKVVSYCAGAIGPEGRQTQAYNLAKLLYQLLTLLPGHKRIALAGHLNEDEDVWEKNDEETQTLLQAICSAPKTFLDTVGEFAADGWEEGCELGGIVAGAGLALISGAVGALCGVMAAATDVIDSLA